MTTAPPGKSLLPQQFYWDTSVVPGKIWAGVPLSVDPAGQQLVLDTGAGIASGTYLPLTGGTVLGRTNVFHAPGPNQVIMDPTSPQAILAAGEQFQSYLAVASTGGTPGQVYTNVAANTNITVAPTTNVWGVLSTVDYSGTGGYAQHVCFYGQNQRHTRNASGQNPDLFGAVFEQIDWTNTDSATGGSMNGIEIDMTCGNTDSGNSRRGFGMYIQKANASDAPAVVSTGVHLAANTGTSYDTMLKMEGAFNFAALDLRLAGASVGAAHHIWLGNAGTMAFDTAASFTLSSDGTGGLNLTGAASQPARITYRSTRTWWSGTWNDGNWYVVDQTAGANRIVIDPVGAIAFNGAATISGGVTLNGLLTANGNATFNAEVSLGRGGADAIVGVQGFVPNNGTSGFLVLPFINGTPTGVPTSNTKGIAVIYDIATHRLFAYAGGAWKASPVFV